MTSSRCDYCTGVHHRPWQTCCDHSPYQVSSRVWRHVLCSSRWVSASLLFSLGRLLQVNLIKWVSNVCPPFHPSVTSTKSFFDFNETWCVGRGRRVMHDGMQYDPIQGQGHEPLKVGNSAIFNGSLHPHL